MEAKQTDKESTRTDFKKHLKLHENEQRISAISVKRRVVSTISEIHTVGI